jgi:hypothetical protein
MSQITLTLEERALIRAQEDEQNAIRDVIKHGVIPNINAVLPMYAIFLERMATTYASLIGNYTSDVGAAASLIPEFVQLLYLVQAKAYEIDAATPGLFGLPTLPQESEQLE